MYSVLLLDTKAKNPNHYLVNALMYALEEHPEVSSVVMTDYGRAISDAKQYSCNLFLAFDGEEINLDICQRVAEICSRSVVWFTEDPYERDVNVKASELFDLVFTNDAGSVKSYGAKGRHLPLAASEKYHFFPTHKSDHDYRYDLFFVGTAWPNRVRLINDILASLHDIKLKLALPSNEHLPEFSLGYPSSFYNWRVPNTEFCRLANNSSVSLSIPRDFSGCGGISVAETPGPRLFELAMAGTFQLVDVATLGVDQFYVEGQDYISFVDADDCIDKLNYYLNNPSERIVIAENAQKKTLEKHTYINRLDIMFGELSKVPEYKALHHKSVKVCKDKVLIVTHNVLGRGQFGGVEVYQDALTQELQDKFELYYYVPADSPASGLSYVVLDCDYIELKGYSATLAEGGSIDHYLSSSSHEKLFHQVLSEYNISLVHFQHFLGHMPSLPFVSKALAIPSVFSVHDYFPICSKFNLLDFRGGYCAPDVRSEKNCDICLREMDGAISGSQSKRRLFMRRVFEQFDIVHANSKSTLNMVKALYPTLKSELFKVEGIPIASSSVDRLKKESRVPNSGLNVAIIGNFTKNKGGDHFVRIFDEMRDCNISFNVHGAVAPEYFEVLRFMSNVNVYHQYTPSEVSGILENIDVSLHLSIWPETYCLTLSEVWKHGVVPIVFDIGALGERVQNSVNGFKVPFQDTGAVVEILQRILFESSELDRIRLNIQDDYYVSLPSHKQWVEDLYSELIDCNSSSISNVVTLGSLDLDLIGLPVNDNKWFKLQPAIKSTTEEIEEVTLYEIEEVTLYNETSRSLSEHLHYVVQYIRRYGILRASLKIVTVSLRRLGTFTVK